MVRPGFGESPIAALLRVALGALWIYDGVVFKLLALNVGLSSSAPAWPLFSWSHLIQLRVEGGLEALLGLLLLRGWLVRAAAAVQGLLLLVLSAEYGLVAPAALLHPLGVVSTNLVLLSASLALAAGPAAAAGRSAQDERLAFMLRLGLGLMWLYEGPVLKWLLAMPLEADLFARSGFVPAHAAAFVRGLGVVEGVLGLTVLAGLWVRRLAVLQVGLLAILTLLLGWTAPRQALDLPGGLSRHLAVIGCALVLYETGAGAYSLDQILARNARWRRRELVALLTWGWLCRLALIEVYRVQQSAAPDADVHAVLLKIEADERNQTRDLLALLQRHGARPLPVTGVAQGVGWLLGCLTVLPGSRVALAFDLWAEGRGLALYPDAANLVPPDEAITARALQAMEAQEAGHQQALRQALRRLRPRRR